MKQIVFLLALSVVLCSVCTAQFESTTFCDAIDPEFPADPLARPAGLNLSYGTTHFVIHYTDTGTNAATAAYAALVGAYAETSWTVEVTQLGYRAPVDDSPAGGDGRYDIYLVNYGQDQGGSVPESPVGGYSKIDNNITHPNHLPLLVAHEFFHGCQYSYPRKTASWFIEASAQWITQNVFPYTFNVYSAVINSQADGPLRGMWNKLSNSSTGNKYGQSWYCDFLIQWTHDSLVIKKIWTKRGETNTFDLFPDINTVLSTNYFLDMWESFRQYAIWRNFVNARADTFHFKNAATAYVYPPKIYSFAQSGAEVGFNYPGGFDTLTWKPSGPGGCRIYGFQPSGNSLTVTFDGQDGWKWEAYMIGMKRPLPSVVSKMTLDANSRGDTTVYWANADSFAIVIVEMDTASNANNLNFSLYATVGLPVTFSNRVHGSEAGGKLLLDNIDTVSSGQSRSLTQGSSHIVRTLNERFTTDSTYKHHDWRGINSKSRLVDTFQVVLNQPEIANFLSLNPVIIRNEIIGAPFVEGGSVEFRDPWYLHSNNTQPDSFFSLPSPLSPTGAFNQSSGGVFLRQGDTTNMQPPYYSVRVPLNQQIGDFQCTFIGWSVSDASLVQVGSNPSGYDQKAVVFKARNAVVKAMYKATSASIVSSLPAQWNLLSVPDTVTSFLKTSVYPGAASSAFAYGTTGYVAKDTLKNGVGYWVKYNSAANVTYTGAPIFKETLNVVLGWNMIGSISVPLPTKNILAIAGAATNNRFFGYSTNYVATDTIKPGYGYWIKCTSAGKLVLNAAVTGNNTPSGTNEQPPEGPPSPPPAPANASPSGIGIGLPVTFAWDGNFQNDTYRLQVDNENTFSTPLVKDTSNIVGTSCTLSGLAASTTYYWRVLEVNAVGESEWSETWSFTTSSGIVLSWTEYNTHPKLTWTVPSGITSPYKVYRYDCVCGEGDCGGMGTQKYSGSLLTYTDNSVIVQGKFDDCASTSYYYVKGTISGTSTLSGASNKVAVNNSNISWKQGRPDIQAELPTETKLKNNYPNPFNPVTVINYSLAEDLYVVLKVYDVLGREVATLVDGFETAGYRIAQFDASALPSGVYIYKFTAGRVTDVKKMLLIR